MKRILFFMATLTLFFFSACVNTTSPNKKSMQIAREKAIQDSIAREIFIKDSIARVEFVKDSIESEKQKAAIISRCASHFNIEKDEFNNLSWVKPITAPKYRNRNGIFCYFSTEDGRAITNFRFVFQYYADDWLFIKKMIFNIDGDNITIVPDMNTDCGNGGKIWEWCDECVNSNTSGLTGEFISKISNAKVVKVKMIGSQYSNVRTVTPAEIKSIKDTYDYFYALGGRFIN